MAQPAHYKHDLGDGLTLDAFSVDPSITLQELREGVQSKDGTAKLDLEKLASEMPLAAHLTSLADLKIEISDKLYEVPEQLQAFRDAVQFQSDSIGRYNGNVLIVDGRLQIPLRTFKGGFYDFIATKLDTRPSELVHEFEILNMLPKGSLFWRAFGKAGGEKKAREIDDKLRGKYGEGRTIEELFREWGVNPDKRARYFAFAYMLRPDNGNEISFVQRAKGMAIAADCISIPGSTPNPPFDEAGFDINSYLREHISKEIQEEFKLETKEFDTGRLYLIDDATQIPFAAVEIISPFTTGNLAERIYGTPDAVKEHPILYSMPVEAIGTFLNRFKIWPSTSFVMHNFYEDEMQKKNRPLTTDEVQQLDQIYGPCGSGY